MNTATKHTIRLSRQERRLLKDITRKGTHKARVITRARILLESDAGIGKDALARQLRSGRSTIQRIRDRFRAGGLPHALAEDPRPGQPPKLTAKAEAHLIALACSDPPEGRVRWTLELLQKRMIADGQVRSISMVALWKRLTKRQVKPWRGKNVVRANAYAPVH